MSTIDLSGLTAYTGKYSRKIIVDLMNGLDFMKDIYLHAGVKNKVKLLKFEVADGVRPFSSTEEVKDGNLKYSDHYLEVTPGKREIPIDPEEYRESYLSEFLLPGSSATQPPSATVPFWKWTLQQVNDKIKEELNDKTAFFGFDRSLATAIKASGHSEGEYITFDKDGITDYYKCIGAAGAGETPVTHPDKWQDVNAEAICVGLGALLEEYIGNNDITQQAIGAITTPTEAVEGFKELTRSHKPAAKKGTIVHLCSYTDIELLADGIEDKAKYVVYDQTRKENINYLVIPNTAGRAVAKPCSWFGDSRRIISGPGRRTQGSLKLPAIHFGTDLLSDISKVKVREPNLWTVLLGYKWLMGFQISNLNALRINDQA